MPEQDDLFERVREMAATLAPSRANETRDVAWTRPDHVLGLSRDPAGRLELFIKGERLAASDRLVADHLRYHLWQTSSGEALSANRLVLPAEPHFDAVAALICAELDLQGVRSDAQMALANSEDVIALALRRVGPGDQVVTGLAGELLLLSALVRRADQPAAVVEAWAGSRPSARDLQLGAVGVEVKTTTGSESVHHVQGFHQIEPGASEGGAVETRLFLLSLGIAWLSEATAYSSSIPALVDDVLEALPSEDVGRDFLARVKQYGGDAAIGYDHDQHRFTPRFARSFHVGFERLYDLTDQRLRLLHRADVDGASHVEPDSVTFRVRLPRKLRGDQNPVTGLAQVVQTILAAAES